MTPEEIKQAMANQPLQFVKAETTFTADELLNNLWNELSYPVNPDTSRRKLGDAEHKTLGIMVDLLYSKIDCERRMRMTDRFIEASRLLNEKENNALKNS